MANSNEQNPQGTFQFTNNYVHSNQGKFINAAKLKTKPIINGNTFEDTTLNDKYLIYISHNQNEIKMINNTFSNIVTGGTSESNCGGIATFLESSLTEFTIKYENCKFYDINNNHNTKPHYQGGAIQYGFSSSNLNAHIEIKSCEFKRNKAIRHGGAVAIRNAKSVTITGSTFEANIANY